VAAAKQSYQNRIVGYGNEAPDQLIPNEKNARIHPTHQADALQGVLSEIGWIQDVIVNKRTSPAWGQNQGIETLVDGHLRVMVALRKGEPSIPVKYIDLSPSEENLALSTFDPLSAAAAWDKEKLDGLLRDVSTGDAAVQQLLADLAESVGIPSMQVAGAGGDDFDVDGALESDGRVTFGDIWTIGGVHRMCCGDSTDAVAVARLMDGERAVLCVTDPPYAVNYDPQWRVGVGGDGKQHTAHGIRIANDDSLVWMKAFDVAPYDVAYIWMASATISLFQLYLEQRDFLMRYLIIWNKDLAVFGRGDYHWKHENCLYVVRKGCTSNWQGARDQKTVWDIPTIHSFKNGHNSEEWGLEGHGNQKPLECMQRPIENNSTKGDSIFDPFLGSGTTLIAAHRTNRRCYGLELEPRYCEVILKRAEAEGLSVELAERLNAENL
jgi:DNA modification methylase